MVALASSPIYRDAIFSSCSWREQYHGTKRWVILFAPHDCAPSYAPARHWTSAEIVEIVEIGTNPTDPTPGHDNKYVFYNPRRANFPSLQQYTVCGWLELITGLSRATCAWYANCNSFGVRYVSPVLIVAPTA